MAYPSRNHHLVARAPKSPVVRESPLQSIRKPYPQRTWNELTVIISGLLDSESTYDLWRNFQYEGEIYFIELFEGSNGRRNGRAKIKFSPPPHEAFWQRYPNGRYSLLAGDGQSKYFVHCSLERQQVPLHIKSPTRNGVWYEPKMKLRGKLLHFGLMVDPSTMITQYTTARNVSFTVDLFNNRIVSTFDVEFKDPRHMGRPLPSKSQVGQYDRVNEYMFYIPFAQLSDIQLMEFGQGAYGLVISLEYPPQFYRKRQDMRKTHAEDNNIWRESDLWYRQTDIIFDPYCLTTAKITLHKDTPVIDIGRWTTYVFRFQRDDAASGLFELIKQALSDFNINLIPLEALKSVGARDADIWNHVDPPNVMSGAADLAYLADGAFISLPFEVRYQLEVCISRGMLNEHNITKAFMEKIAAIATANPEKARDILEYCAAQDKRIYDPMTLFVNPDAMSFSAKTDIPHYCAYSRKAMITPTTVYFSSPTVETTNRVLRHYSQENRDSRFLRVQFTDELPEGRINSSADKQMNDELFTRVYRTLYNGIQIGNRHYQFLAFGNSQFRENGAYFFCPTEHLSCNNIRQWMGNFSEIKVVAKYAARLGQCFSTTRAIHGLAAPDIVPIDDIITLDLETQAEYCFTDGVGKISPFLAQMISHELGIRGNAPPSAFQFRLGGCKGMLVTWPDAKDTQVHIRRSQEKFTAAYNGLEIIRCSRCSIATLNRQTITLLSSMGVPDEVFLKMLTEQLSDYQDAMHNDDEAIRLLLTYIDDNQMTVNIATMIRNGFMAQRDPFVLSLLHLWRAWSIKLLKEKAKIIVKNGAFILGCVDETRTLRGYTKPVVSSGQEIAVEDLPQIFLQIPDKKDPEIYNVITGICLVGRNPSLHPGDLRVVRAVDIGKLHHLRDVVVFPAKGDRDIPSMCSGGDLDGDDYFVLWDPELQPKEWTADPMNYTPPEAKKVNRPVEITDLMKFFVRYMKNDALPTIALAHLAQSDFLDNSVKDPKCLKLAQLHSKAVDYVKTGEPAQMPKHLRPRKWPHFMEKKFKKQASQYHSQKVLGKLYDKVETVRFTPQWTEPFDERILRAYDLDSSLLKTARQIKSKYDTAMRRVLAQQEIETEFEFWSGFVLSKPRFGSDYKLQEEIGRLSESLKDQFRTACIEAVGSEDFSVLGPFVAAMYRVTKEEMDIALAECRTPRLIAGQETPKRKMEQRKMPLITFPWLFEKELGRIATGIETGDELENLGLTNIVPGELGRKRHRAAGEADDDFIRREDGVIIHRGEELIVFDDDSEELSDTGGCEELRPEHDNLHDSTTANDHEPALAGELITSSVPDHLLSGTGVEDVVPRTELDGLIGSQTHESNNHASPGITTSNQHGRKEGSRTALALSTPFSTKHITKDDPRLQASNNTGSVTSNFIGSYGLVQTPQIKSSAPGYVDLPHSTVEDQRPNPVHLAPLAEPGSQFIDIVSARLDEADETVEEEHLTVVTTDSSLEKLALLYDS